MCIAPNILADGQPVACHKCWQCRELQINDYVGRNIAESKTAVACHAVTLTYGRDDDGNEHHERTTLLTYSDVQKYIKLLRFHGFPVRYFVTGEFGAKFGRAHWHMMCYWQDKHPAVELDKEKLVQGLWDRGFSKWTAPTHRAIRYNCKYIQKDMGDDLRQGHVAMSKKPPLGTDYFYALAGRYVDHGFPPQELNYEFADVERTKPNGQSERVRFRLKDRSAELFLSAFIEQWRARYDRHWGKSDLVDLFDEYGRVIRDEALVGRPRKMALLYKKAMPISKPDPTRLVLRQKYEGGKWVERWVREDGSASPGLSDAQYRALEFRLQSEAFYLGVPDE